MWRILAVDDEENILKAVKRSLISLNGQKLQIDTYTSPIDAIRRAQDGIPFDLVLSDYRMPEMNGVAFLKEFKKIQPDAMRIILSGYADLAALIDAINEVGIYRFIPKPWNDYDVVQAAEQAIAHRRLLLENRRLADLVRLQRGRITRQELEFRRIEEETPGITKVKWGPDGEVILEDFE